MFFFGGLALGHVDVHYVLSLFMMIFMMGGEQGGTRRLREDAGRSSSLGTIPKTMGA